MLAPEYAPVRYTSNRPSPIGKILFGMLLVAVVLLQWSFLPATGWLRVFPDLVMILVLIRASSSSMSEGILWAAGTGLWIDLLSLDLLGTHVLALLPVAVLGALVGQRLFRSGALLPLLVVAASTAVYWMALNVLSPASGSFVQAGGLRMIAALAVLNMLVMPIFYFVLLLAERWLPRRV